VTTFTTPPIFTGRMPSCHPTYSVKALKATNRQKVEILSSTLGADSRGLDSETDACWEGITFAALCGKQAVNCPVAGLYQLAAQLNREIVRLITHKCPCTSLVSPESVPFPKIKWQHVISLHMTALSMSLSLVTVTCAVSSTMAKKGKAMPYSLQECWQGAHLPLVSH